MHISLNGKSRCWKNARAAPRLLRLQSGSFYQLQPFLDSTRLTAIAIVIQNALAPGQTKREILAACQYRGVLDGNMFLVVIPIQGPSLQLPASEFSFMHLQVKRVLMMVAFRPNRVKSSDEFAFLQQTSSVPYSIHMSNRIPS